MMASHSQLFKDYIITTSTRSVTKQSNIPNVHDEVRLQTNMGEEVLATVTLVDSRQRVFDCTVLSEKPSHIPTDLNSIAFSKIRFIYTRNTGMLP
ncbi:hypothetical protein L1D14_04200 [Vibrio tubiashii]|uniref:hypothetical protein n=1 Tax=Vibrio tubiashii TaxID=29498 RepID=UPI001EFED84B|nr:hypothetical protein [Vibrio tubiashii]MCG9575433.1 hypothetical protein [Vibrio tubiashii]